MTLMQAWKSSLSLLKWQNLKMFLLVTLKSIVEAYKVLFHYWGWLLVTAFVCYLAPYALSAVSVEYFSLMTLDLVYQVLLFATLLSTRPSIGLKNFLYFRGKMIIFLPIFIGLFFLPLPFWPSALSPFYLFALLFVIDSQQGVNEWLKSFFNSIKMIIYNYPLLVVIGLFFHLILYIFYSYFYVVPSLQILIAVLLLPISVCTYTNIYVKMLHEQFDLYCNQPQ